MALSLYCAASVHIQLAKDEKGYYDTGDLDFLVTYMAAIARDHVITRSFLQQALRDIECSGITISPRTRQHVKIPPKSTFVHSIPLLARRSPSGQSPQDTQSSSSILPFGAQESDSTPSASFRHENPWAVSDQGVTGDDGITPAAKRRRGPADSSSMTPFTEMMVAASTGAGGSSWLRSASWDLSTPSSLDPLPPGPASGAPSSSFQSQLPAPQTTDPRVLALGSVGGLPESSAAPGEGESGRPTQSSMDTPEQWSTNDPESAFAQAVEMLQASSGSDETLEDVSRAAIAGE